MDYSNALFRAVLCVLWITLATDPLSTCHAEDSKVWQPPSSLDSLPSIPDLPPLLRFADGRNVKMPDQWQARRAEMMAIVKYFEYGHFPARPDKVTVVDRVIELLDNEAGTQERNAR